MDHPIPYSLHIQKFGSKIVKESVTSSPSEQWISHFYDGKEMPVPTLEAIGFKNPVNRIHLQ